MGGLVALEGGEGVDEATHQRALGTVASCALFLLTCTLMVTSSHAKAGTYSLVGRVDTVTEVMTNN